eukprot:g28843.t1
MYIRFAVAALVIGTSLYLLVELANCQFSGTLTPTRAGHMWLQTASLIGSSNLLATGLDPWPPQHRPNGTLLKQPWVSGGQENPCVPALHHLSPRGDYEYHPSDVEKEWMKFPRRKKICKTAREQQEQSRIWMNYTASSIDGQNTTYLLPENACTKDGNRAKGVFFDLGSGQNVRDFEMYDYAEGSGMGSSIPLFFRMYADRCIDFHAIYAWEVRHVDHNQDVRDGGSADGAFPESGRMLRVEYKNQPYDWFNLDDMGPLDGILVSAADFLRSLRQPRPYIRLYSLRHFELPQPLKEQTAEKLASLAQEVTKMQQILNMPNLSVPRSPERPGVSACVAPTIQNPGSVGGSQMQANLPCCANCGAAYETENALFCGKCARLRAEEPLAASAVRTAPEASMADRLAGSLAGPRTLPNVLPPTSIGTTPWTVPGTGLARHSGRHD